ncbi:Coatomer subunit beta-like [Oopsacas minuta]|uniref:Coatomer subunit beta-like n=1 Tax=Oopsacas minuta TaxID=111878 RepID=A0AAV7JL37_9METZ|nr:Coatomer subunit beta-like [Oopsacas minuta]
MKCLTPPKALSGECDFLSANLYAKSIFGEEALANISLKNPQDKDVSVTGHVRIRAKSQGMALSLGDKINISQKKEISVSAFLRRELTQTSDQSQEDENIKYKRHLILCLHTCCSMFPEIASSILPSMMDSVLDQNHLIACDVLKLVREITHLYPTLREDLIRRLIEVFSQVQYNNLYDEEIGSQFKFNGLFRVHQYFGWGVCIYINTKLATYGTISKQLSKRRFYSPTKVINW